VAAAPRRAWPDLGKPQRPQRYGRRGLCERRFVAGAAGRGGDSASATAGASAASSNVSNVSAARSSVGADMTVIALGTSSRVCTTYKV